jgi:glycosyltransferase involved in cell wall biosynthesis
MVKNSIIIPTCGRPLSVRATIQSLLALSPSQLGAEILVIDNNISPRLSEDLQGYCTGLADQVRYIREPSIGLSAARNRGICEAQGEIISFIDDDVEVSTGWLIAIQNRFLDPNVNVVGGPSIPKFTSSIPNWLFGYIKTTPYGGWKCVYLSLLDIGRDVSSINPYYIWGLNFSARKSVLLKCGGFPPDLVPTEFQRWQGDGDSGLSIKLRSMKYRADYIQAALVYHNCGDDRLNIDYFTKRFFSLGVCESYSNIRYGKTRKREPIFYLIKRFFRKRQMQLQNLANLINRKQLFWINDFRSVRRLTEQSRLAGWEFHQKEVAQDKSLLEWVRRENYFGTNILELSNAPLCTVKQSQNE